VQLDSVEAVNSQVRSLIQNGRHSAALVLFNAFNKKRPGAPNATTYALAIEAAKLSRDAAQVSSLIRLSMEHVPMIDGQLAGIMLTSLAKTLQSSEAVLGLHTELTTKQPHLTTLPHALKVQQALVEASRNTRDLKTCLGAAHRLLHLTQSPPEPQVLTHVLDCYSLSLLFKEHLQMLLSYLSALRTRRPHNTYNDEPRYAPDEAGGGLRYVIHRALAHQERLMVHDPGDGGLLLLEEILYTGGSFLGEGLGIEHFNRVLRIFVRLGQMVRAHEMLEDLQKHGIQPNIDSYNAIIYGYALLGRVESATDYYNCILKKGIKPNRYTFNSLLRAQLLKVGLQRKALNQRLSVIPFERFTPTQLVSQQIKKKYEQLVAEIEAHGLSGDPKLFSVLLYGLSLANLSDTACSLLEEAVARGNQLDSSSFNRVLYGITLERSPSQKEKILRIFQLMERANVQPTAVTYSTLLNAYVSATLANLDRQNDGSINQTGRSFFINALSIYNILVNQSKATNANVRTKDLDFWATKGRARVNPFNIFFKLVGMEDAFQLSDSVIDSFQQETPMTRPITDEDNNGPWTSMSVTALRKTFGKQPLPLPNFVPQTLPTLEMTPLELLLWRDLAATSHQPDIVSYNELILSLTLAGKLSHAERYMDFILGLAASSSLSCFPSAGQGFLEHTLNAKFEAYLIKRRNDQHAQLASLNNQAEERSVNSGSLLFLRTLVRMGEQYLRREQFDGFIKCLTLAKQSYPISGDKAFRFLIHIWNPTQDKQNTLEDTLRKQSIAFPSATNSG